MKNILIVILVTLIGIKITIDCTPFSNKSTVTKLAEKAEESKNEKEENKPKKRYSEDLYYNRTLIELPAKVTAVSATSSHNQLPYLGFINKPNTPPPDLA
ncbi:MAG: hypothetical protein JWQ96_1441 [Segetibacter sp.]|nr:hypothetical protein [Segetibacter sp.]